MSDQNLPARWTTEKAVWWSTFGVLVVVAVSILGLGN